MKSAREQLLDHVRARAVQDGSSGDHKLPDEALDRRFKDDATAASVPMSAVYDAYEKAYREAAANRPWLTRLLEQLAPRGGWIVGGLAIIALFFRDQLLRGLTRIVDAIRSFIYVRMAGTRMFRSMALAKYRRAVKTKHARIKLPFRPDRPLDMEKVFVPLRLKSGVDTALIDADACIRDKKRLMVTGMPGAGKSMLLKNLAWRYSREGLRIGSDLVPVLIELSRFNDSAKTIEEMIVDAFARDDFPRANVFVDAALNNGSLMVLFDGLDEVNSAKRQSVAASITDFLDRYDKCRSVITCRAQVYNNQFLNVVDMTLEVAEFTDQQVRTFLTAWGEHMPPGKSVEQLMQTLIKRPPIMLLARNPLLLTIIAFLYSDTDFELPHSRSQFYSKAVDVLLDQWNVTQNRYSAAQKNMVLRHLALVNQDGGKESSQSNNDRRTIELTVALREIKTVLPRLNLADDQAEPILKEIVERSGLLMLIDAGERCQFAHLTLQEFMSATALRDDPAGLIKRFREDRDAWREVVKLWCGLDVNSTRVIDEIYTFDPVTAFDCLADTLSIDTEAAERIIRAFCDNFAHDVRDDVSRAFAAVASSSRPRGRALFAFLEDRARNGTHSERALAIAALVMTNLPAAAEVIVESAYSKHWLPRMGDIAIPAIVKSELPALTKLHLLYQIGTPFAARAIVPSLWSVSPAEQLDAAASVASLLSGAGVEAALEEISLTPEQRAWPHLPWVWKPLGDHATSSLAAIVNRAAYVIAENPEDLPDRELDPRVAVPLAVAAAEKHYLDASRLMQRVDVRKWEWVLREAPELLKETAFDQSNMFKAVARYLSKDERDSVKLHRLNFLNDLLQEYPRLHALVRRTRGRHCIGLVSCLLGKPKPLVSDWTSINEPINYTYRDGWHLRAICGLIVALTGGAFYYVVRADLLHQWKWVVGIVLAVLYLSLLRGDRESVEFTVMALAFLPVALIFVPFLVVEEIKDSRKKKAPIDVSDLLGVVALFLACGLIGLAIWTSTLWGAYRLLATWVSPYVAIGMVGATVAAGILLAVRGKHLDRAAQNPLRRLFTAPGEIGEPTKRLFTPRLKVLS